MISQKETSVADDAVTSKSKTAGNPFSISRVLADDFGKNFRHGLPVKSCSPTEHQPPHPAQSFPYPQSLNPSQSLHHPQSIHQQLLLQHEHLRSLMTSTSSMDTTEAPRLTRSPSETKLQSESTDCVSRQHRRSPVTQTGRTASDFSYDLPRNSGVRSDDASSPELRELNLSVGAPDSEPRNYSLHQRGGVRGELPPDCFYTSSYAGSPSGEDSGEVKDSRLSPGGQHREGKSGSPERFSYCGSPVSPVSCPDSVFEKEDQNNNTDVDVDDDVTVPDVNSLYTVVLLLSLL